MSTTADKRYLDALLKSDALADAERVTGESYKDDESTLALGFLMHMRLGEEKERALSQRGDSYFSQHLAGCLATYEALGFSEALCDEFTGQSWSGEPAPHETFRILWHPEGLLATVESYNTTGRNGTKVYYNLRLRDMDARGWHEHISSGHLTGDVWIGDHDGREGIGHSLSQLRSVGDFLRTWVESPFLWLLTYMDSKAEGYDYEAINAERISRLPEHVRAAIGGAR